MGSHPVSTEMQGFAELLRGHGAFLNMLARLYFEPLSQEELDRIAAMDPDQFAFDHDLITKGFREMIAYLHTGSSTLRQDINVDYTAAFYGISAYEGRTANPCESVFRSEDGILMQKETRDVYRAYKREAIKKEDDVNVPEDHISFELQFLAILGNRAADHIEAGEYDEALHNVKVEQQFIDEHLLTWFDSMAQVALHILEKPFYKGLLDVTKGFLETECSDLDEIVTALYKVGATCADDQS